MATGGHRSTMRQVGWRVGAIIRRKGADFKSVPISRSLPFSKARKPYRGRNRGYFESSYRPKI